MTTEFKLPELGENVESGDVLSVLVSEGDQVQKNQNVLELETDKATVEVPCPHAGRVKEVKVKQGETINVGQAVLILEDGKDGEKPAASEKKKEKQAPKAKEEKPEPKKAEQKDEGKVPKKAEKPKGGGEKNFDLPELGEDVESGDVLKILVSEGDQIEADQNVMELETDKATIEVPCPFGGTITSLKVKEGDTVKVGQTVLTVSTEDGEKTAPEPEAEEPKRETKKAEKEEPEEEKEPSAKDAEEGGEIEFTLPELGENIESGDILSILIAKGDEVKAGQNVIEIETDKATVELPCPYNGRVADVHVKEGEKVPVGGKLMTIAFGPETPGTKREAPKEQPEKAKPEPHVADEEDVRTIPQESMETISREEDRDRRPPAPAAPATRKLARELGVDLYQVDGSGYKGRITQDDVKNFVRQSGGRAQAAPGAPSAMPSPELPDFSEYGEIERQKLSGIRRKIAENMALSWQQVPHVTHFDETDITELEAARKRYGKGDDGVKITVTVLAVKAIVAALKEFPQVNSSIDLQNNELILKHHYHIGIAVDTEHGLMVPVLRDADQKSVQELAAELNDLAAKARERKISPKDLQGGTFTITNLGGIGGTNFTPIVYYPQVAIMGMARGRKVETTVNGRTETRMILPLSLSYDHRAVDGADAARFLRTVAQILSDPFNLLIES